LCDGIYTHFPADENQTVTLGRLGEESERFSKICKTATSESLLLFNESFATTSHTESLYIAEDVLKYLCCLGARTCFNTHMHELAENADNLQCERSICGAASVVMGKSEGENTYKLTYEKPNGKSYAHSIAFQYGITLEQLFENL
ncbi:MAG: DNA mismatch repair protein, partial [Ruminococcus sp.]|nr:DNA mismatch repair protein [Ruminococcus sp.]